jgi:hypothetical protein
MVRAAPSAAQMKKPNIGWSMSAPLAITRRCRSKTIEQNAAQDDFLNERGFDEICLPPQQPDHDFKPDSALVLRFDFGGFIPRHVLPALAVEHFQDIAKVKGLCTVSLLDVIVMSYINHWS